MLFEMTYALRKINKFWEFKSLLPTKPQILKSHLIIKSNQLENYFDKIKYRNIFNVNELGKCLI